MKTNFDSPWKLVLEKFFYHFIDFFLPALVHDIDWKRQYQFLDKELLAIQKNTVVRNRIADKLIKVFRINGEEAWVIVHIEIQGEREKNFEVRMFQYYYRIFDRYKKPLMSLAILTDTNKHWRPSEYHQRLWGCHLSLIFPMVKLIDIIPRINELSNIANPISKVIEAHLAALKSKKDPTLKLSNKINLVKKLYVLGYTKEDVTTLYTFIDYVLDLPPMLERTFIKTIKDYEDENNMHYITSAERLGKEDGIKQGLQQGKKQIIQFLLEEKFGNLHSEYVAQIEMATSKQIEQMCRVALKASNIEEVFDSIEINA